MSCNGFKFGSLGISLSGDIERVERVFLSMSSYAVGVSVLRWCRFGISSRVSSLFIVALKLKQLNYTIITKNKINNNIK